jgi:phospholipid/cholesterol/gamma-HCH transport system ATP-binding protein
MNPSHSHTSLAPALDMRELTISALKHPGQIVARDVTWTVQRGEFWVVGAPQHSGKSDFLAAAGGILAPVSGEYAFLGEAMPIFDEARMAHRLKLGLVFDGGQLLGSLTIAENIALPLQYHSGKSAAEITARVEELMHAMELTPWANISPVRVARSWQQRAGLARALALSPEVLLLDSPLTGLDVRHTFWWQQILRELQRGHALLAGRPLTLVATADDLRPWRRLAGQVACLSGRRLVVVGDWAAVEVCEDPLLRELLRE